MLHLDDIIVAPATALGGALTLIRISGNGALDVCDKIFRSPAGKKLTEQKGYSLHYGDIVRPDGGVLDDVVVSVFRAPNSYTGEDMAEISCHGSRYITAEIINLLIAAGARAANAGEFTARAFIAGKLDLSQAEAVADMIASHDRATHSLAATQMRGGYSEELDSLRDELLRLVSLLELELDFSEEDVTFADRAELAALMEKIIARTEELIGSFALGNAIKEGVGVAIIGSPNAGKSTLLNTLLNEDRAMVSDIAGTTRDAIEERITLNGVEFRFIDTAGIRASDDTLEQMGIERTFKAIGKARIILYLFDIGVLTASDTTDDIIAAAQAQITAVIEKVAHSAEQELCILLNKYDTGSNDGFGCNSDSVEKGYEDNCAGNRESRRQRFVAELESRTGRRVIPISAKYGYNIGELTAYLTSLIDTDPIYGGTTIVSNSRHYEALLKTRQSLRQALAGMRGITSDSASTSLLDSTGRATDRAGMIIGLSGDESELSLDAMPLSAGSAEGIRRGSRVSGISGKQVDPVTTPDMPEESSAPSISSVSSDLIAQDLREALHWLGTIVGEITTDEILENIFSKFCIGK